MTAEFSFIGKWEINHRKKQSYAVDHSLLEHEENQWPRSIAIQNTNR